MQVYVRALLLSIIIGATMGAVAASIAPDTQDGLARYECNHMIVFQKPSLLNAPDACKHHGGIK